MLTPGLAVPVTANPGRVAYPSSGPSQQWTAVELANASPYVVAVYIGGQYIKSIQAWNVDVIGLAGSAPGIGAPGQPITFQTTAPAGGAPTGGDSTLYPTFAMYGDQFNAAYPYSLTAQAIAAAIAGTVQSTGFEVQLTGSPFSFTASPQTQNFPIPAGTPNLSGLLVACKASSDATGSVQVVGHNSGLIYLPTTALLIGGAPFRCDFYSVIDPGGVDVTYHHFGGAGTHTDVYIVGVVESQLVRPVHGPAVDGPQLVAQANQNGAGSSALFQVPNNGQYRVWSMTIAATGAGLAQVTAGFQISIIGGGANSITFEGGLPLGPLTSATVAAQASVNCFGAVAYSIDA